jgi:hypothetical protein
MKVSGYPLKGYEFNHQLDELFKPSSHNQYLPSIILYLCSIHFSLSQFCN